MKSKKKSKYILVFILLFLISGFFIYVVSEKSKNNDTNKNYYDLYKANTQDKNNSAPNLDISNTEEEKAEKKYPKEEIPEEYKGYDVCAKLEIPKISLETYVLSDYSVKALNVSVTKFWGADPNHNGNFCIAGHNFRNNKMFYNLKKLENGDNLFITDREIGKVEYEVFQMEKVIPEDVSCLDPVTKNQKEVTLITCTTDSQKRIIIKAKEKE